MFTTGYIKPLGYYNSKNQVMHPEENYPETAKQLVSKLAKLAVGPANAVFIFASSNNILMAYYKGSVRLTNVRLNKRHLHWIKDRRWISLKNL